VNYKLRELTSHQAQVLEPGDCRVGREEMMDFVLDETSVSRHHANLHNSPEGVVWVIDLGSTNGTKLDGQPVRDWTQVQPGQVITFGDIEVRLEDEAVTPPERPAHTPVNTPEADSNGRIIPKELGPNPTASGKLPKVTAEKDSKHIVSPKNLLAVKPKKASGIVLPPRSSLSAQITPPGDPQKKLVSNNGLMMNGEVSNAIDTLELPDVRRRAHRQVDNLVKRANAIAQSTPPERNTGQIIEVINQEEEQLAAEKNRRTDGFKLPAPKPNGAPKLRAAPQPRSDGTAPVPAAELSPVNGKPAPVPAPGEFVHPGASASTATASHPVTSGHPVAAPRPQVQPQAEPAPAKQPLPPMARMPSPTPAAPASAPQVEVSGHSEGEKIANFPGPQMVAASEVAFYKSMAFLGLGLILGFLAGVAACKYLLPML